MTDNESIIKRSRCNCRVDNFDPFGWIVGKLHLTKTRIFFKSHFLNIQNNDFSVPLENIASIEAKYNDFVSQKLTIFLNDGSIMELRLPKRHEWINAIGEALKNINREKGEFWELSDILNTKSVVMPKTSWVMAIIKIILFIFSVSILNFMMLYLLG